ncbi:g8234 [Coccomyxa elongata]
MDSLRSDGLIADKPPPSWKRSSTSYIRVSADTASSADGEPQLLSLSRITSKAAPKAPPLQPPPKDVTDRENSTPPVSPVKNTWDDGLQAATTPKTPRLPPPPTPSAASETTPDMAAEQQDSLNAPHSAGGGSHRRTTSWGGSPTASGRHAHRRSRSIEVGGPGEAYRQELERIGSMDKGSESSKSSTPRRMSVAVPMPEAPGAVGQRRPSLPSPLKLASAAERVQPPATASLAAPLQVKVKGARGGTEPELISWDEVEAQKDVYEAITTADGRQALVKAAPGKPAAEELLFLEEAAPIEPAAAASPAGYALAGAVPMVAVPVRYPDGRLMYHVYPVAQPAVQVNGALSPAASPQVLSPRVQQHPQGSSPHFPGSPVSAASPPPTGHQRRASLSVPSPLQAASAPAYSMPNAFASGFAAAAGVASPTPSSPPVYEHVLQGAPSGPLSSGPLSPAMSSAHSGHLIAAAVGGAGAAAFGAMSLAGSGHLYGSPLPGHAHAQTLSSQLGHTAAAQHYQVASPRQQDLHQQMASMQLGSGLAAAKEDPFGGSAVWGS